MEEFALIKSRVNLNRVNLGIALISDLKVSKLALELKLVLDFGTFYYINLDHGPFQSGLTLVCAIHLRYLR